jgi:hypothetical protein
MGHGGGSDPALRGHGLDCAQKLASYFKRSKSAIPIWWYSNSQHERSKLDASQHIDPAVR